MRLLIETLTGASMELRVSPFATVLDVKERIQKLEGKWFWIGSKLNKQMKRGGRAYAETKWTCTIKKEYQIILVVD